MPETDADLLQDFTQNHSQIAFSRLVERYSDLVFAAARRQVADPATAEDIIQAAFLLTQSPDKTAPRRCIQLFRLPIGAKLLDSSDNIVTRNVDGQTELFMETVIPAGGANTVAFHYSLRN
jgi:hypothetical protein